MPDTNQPKPSLQDSLPADTINVSSGNTMELPRRSGAGKVILIVVMVILLLAAVGGGIWYYMNSQAQNKQQQQQSQIDGLNAKVSTLEADLAKAQNSVLSGTDQKSLQKTISGFYDLWIKGINSNPQTSRSAMVTQAQNDGMISAAVAKYINTTNANDPVTCSAKVASSYEYIDKDQAATSSKAETTFKTTDASSKSTLTLTKTNGNWVITTITCPTT